MSIGKVSAALRPRSEKRSARERPNEKALAVGPGLKQGGNVLHQAFTHDMRDAAARCSGVAKLEVGAASFPLAIRLRVLPALEGG